MPLLFQKIADGQSLRSACTDLGLDPPSTHRFIDEDREFSQQYTRAKEVRGEYYADQVIGTAARVISKQIKPDAGRVAIDAFKWVAGRMAPKTYGDKVAHEHTGKDGGPIEHAHDLSQLSDDELDKLDAIAAKLGVAGPSGEDRS